MRLQSSTSASAVLPPVVNGVSSAQNIANMWGNHYGQLLNRNEASFNKGDRTVFDFDECKADTYETIKPYFCAFQLAQFLSQKLKLNCAPGFDGVFAYHIIFAHEIPLLLISMFFNLCLVHCYVPNLCSYSVLTPNMKRKHDDVTAFSNYRPIALATIFSKFLELFILHRIKEFLVSVDNQLFGFKSSHSTDMCLFLLKQTIAQYNEKICASLFDLYDKYMYCTSV